MLTMRSQVAAAVFYRSNWSRTKMTIAPKMIHPQGRLRGAGDGPEGADHVGRDGAVDGWMVCRIFWFMDRGGCGCGEAELRGLGRWTLDTRRLPVFPMLSRRLKSMIMNENRSIAGPKSAAEHLGCWKCLCPSSAPSPGGTYIPS